MNDPWDVKSVRHPSQYTSCMKLNGVPLLPPLLSRECRKEMQYYRLLAKEVENRIETLKSLVSCESDPYKTDAIELSGFDSDSPQPEVCLSPFNTSGNKSHLVESLQKAHIHDTPKSRKHKEIMNNVSIDLNIELKGNRRHSGRLDSMSISKKAIDPQIPERDCDGLQQTPAKEVDVDTKEVDVDTISGVSPSKPKELMVFRDLNHDILNKYFPTDLDLIQEGPSSLSSKSFTGSLIDIHTESLKSQGNPTLVRQSSYTVLHPSPQLLAHLEVQSMSTGVDMQSISMSDSVSNLTMQNNKNKRRIWDLESAKNKWSTMALELDRKSNAKTKQVPKSAGNSARKVSPPPRSKSVAGDKPRQSSLNSKSPPKTEAAKVTPKKKNANSNVTCSTPKSITKDCVDKSPKSIQVPSKKVTPQTSNGSTPPSPRTPVNGKSYKTPVEDPATKVKELYEKIQKQQLMQMATLVEKQKREQQLLQEVFQEQNNLLYNQLKTVCPKSPLEARPAWGEEALSGPVSLSQLIDKRDVSPTSTLTRTSDYIHYCDDVLKKSRDITSSIKKLTTPTRMKTSRPESPRDPYRTRTNSPNLSLQSTPRYLDSTSNGRDSEFILTDRTNDTMADLNVTFATDSTDAGHDTVIRQMCLQELTVVRGARVSAAAAAAAAVAAQTSRLPPTRRKIQYSNPTPEERAAATVIVAYAKGYLVRRLMRTERVQATVQTIRDALLCALQLHQDRDGIRGADVQLHRRLIQQITAACYSLHDTFVAAPAAARCAAIAADRARRRTLLQRATPPPPQRAKRPDVMSQSHSGVIARPRKTPPSSMTQSNYESFSDLTRPSRIRRPWR